MCCRFPYGSASCHCSRKEQRLLQSDNSLDCTVSSQLPSSAGGGVAEDRGGVVRKFLDHTTPSTRTNEASRLFLIVQPPLLLLRRGADCCNFQSAAARQQCSGRGCRESDG